MKKVEIFNKLKRLKCDLACLQEVHVVPDELKTWVLRNYGFHLHCCSQAHAGTAIVTKEAVERECVVPATLQGRLTHVVLTSGTHVLSIYTPTQNMGDHGAAIQYINSLKRYMRNFRQEKIILGGDFNFVEGGLDRGTGTVLTGDILYHRHYKEIYDMCGLSDSFRTIHPNMRNFTYFRGLRRSRIDRVYTNLKDIVTIQHFPVSFSDHQGIIAKFKMNETGTKFGRGFWKLNVSLLNDNETIKDVETFWRGWFGRKLEFECPILWWEKGKVGIRNIFKKHGIRLKKLREDNLRV
jgi:exonuclease III